MSARVVDESSISLPVRGSKLDEHGIYAEPNMSAAIHEALLALSRSVAAFRNEER